MHLSNNFDSNSICLNCVVQTRDEKKESKWLDKGEGTSVSDPSQMMFRAVYLCAAQNAFRNVHRCVFILPIKLYFIWFSLCFAKIYVAVAVCVVVIVKILMKQALYCNLPLTNDTKPIDTHTKQRMKYVCIERHQVCSFSQTFGKDK